MTAHSDAVTHSDRSFRWLVLPTAAALLAAAAFWRRRIEPAELTPVSAEWLRTQGMREGRQHEL